MNNKSKDEIESHDHEMISEIATNLQKLDQSYSVYSPDLQWFEQMVKAEQEQHRKKFKRDIFLFSLCAIILLSLGLVAILHVPGVFLVIQIVLSVSLPIFAYLLQRKRVTHS